jgi:5'(3')-deoxyribonucleotidase
MTTMTMNITINFDMDGTIADLYANPNWLPMLRAYDPTPYETAKPLLRMATLARKLNDLQRQGYRIAVISWLSKESNASYDKAVTEAKMAWLAKHLPSVRWDEITIVPYGTPKQLFCHTPLDILFDDEERNRENWAGEAYDVNNIIEILKNL